MPVTISKFYCLLILIIFYAFSAQMSQLSPRIAAGARHFIVKPKESWTVDRLQGTNKLKDARGHKKKKRKAIKKALIKLVLIALLIKSKLKILLVAFQTFLGFKAAVLITVLVITHAIKLWAEIKHHQHPQKVIYYENAHHQHHYDHHDHDDHHGWSLWGRKGDESTSESSGPLSFLPSFLSRRTDAGADMAYNAYKPTYDSQDQSYDPYYNTHPYNGNAIAPGPSYRSLDSNTPQPVPQQIPQKSE